MQESVVRNQASHGRSDIASVARLPYVHDPSPCLQKLDALRWEAALMGVSHGVRVGIRVNDVRALDLLPGRLPPRWRRVAPGRADRLCSLIVGGPDPRRPRIRRFHLAYNGARRLQRSTDLDVVLDALESDLHFTIAQSAVGHRFVHAGVVEWRGRAIVIPGRSRTGKTTLVASLLEAGARYLSDEYAVLDDRGYVHPYSTALSMRALDADTPRRVPASELGASVGKQPLPLGCVIVTQFVPEATWRPRQLSPGRTALKILSNTVTARKDPDTALAVLARAVDNAVCFRSKRGEAAAVAPRILALAETASLHPDPGNHP